MAGAAPADAIACECGLPFSQAKVVGNRVVIWGYLPTKLHGSLWSRIEKVGFEVGIEEAYAAARQVGLCMLGTVKRDLGSLGRISNWI